MRVAPTEKTVQTYAIEVLASTNSTNEDGSLPTIRLSHLFLHELEENITDLLPTGFSVRIKEWDE